MSLRAADDGRRRRDLRLRFALGRQEPDTGAEDGDDDGADKGGPAALVSCFPAIRRRGVCTRWPFCLNAMQRKEVIGSCRLAAMDEASKRQWAKGGRRCR